MDKRLHISCNWLGESSSGGMCNHFQFSINFLLLQLLQSYLKGLYIPPLEDSPNQLHEMCNCLSIGLYRRKLYIKYYVIGCPVPTVNSALLIIVQNIDISGYFIKIKDVCLDQISLNIEYDVRKLVLIFLVIQYLHNHQRSVIKAVAHFA